MASTINKVLKIGLFLAVHFCLALGGGGGDLLFRSRRNHRQVEAHQDEPVPVQYDGVAYCEAYCDVNGYYQPGKWCVSSDSSVDVFCCGDLHYRYCCIEPEKDVGGEFETVKQCENSSWIYYQWRVIVGLLATLVVMLLFAACCYYCYGGGQGYGRARATRIFARATGRGDPESAAPVDTTFDPQSPNAFRPPDYSLPKDPPKYSDVVNGTDNLAFNSTHDTPVVTGTDSQTAQATTPTENTIEDSTATILPPASMDITLDASVVIEREAPPMYEEIDSNTMLPSPQSVSTQMSGSPAPVHHGNTTSRTLDTSVAIIRLDTSISSSDSSDSTTSYSSTNSSRNGSVTTLGSQREAEPGLTSVEQCSVGPPPYEESSSDAETPRPVIQVSNGRGTRGESDQ